MRRLHQLLSPFLGICLACTASPTPASPSSDPVEESPTASLPFTGETLVFPPPPTRRERRTLPPRLAPVDDKPEAKLIAVTSPSLDKDNKFEFSGQSFYVAFNKIAVHAKASTPPLKITPWVPGKTRWTGWSGHSGVSFKATEPFDPAQVYSVEVGPVKDSDGNSTTWNAKFQADPQIWVAGKLLNYLPRKGVPRIVSVQGLPYTTGPRPGLEVLFDQAVTAAGAGDLFELVESGGSKVPLELSLSRSKKPRFNGYTVERNNIIVATPKFDLKRGASYELSVRDSGAKFDDGETHSFRIANPLQLTKIDCGYAKGCTSTPGNLKMQGRVLVLHFNNRMQWKKNQRWSSIKVTPPVRNLSVYAQGAKLRVSGEFKPSTTYALRLGAARDSFDSALLRPVELTIETVPLAASVAMATGQQFLDEDRSRHFTVTTRNVDRAKLRVWKVEHTAAAWSEASRRVSNREAPTGPPSLELALDADEKLNAEVKTEVDLLKTLAAGNTYVVQLEATSIAFGAAVPDYPTWSWAAKPPIALITVNDGNAMAVHARTTADRTLVHVASLKGGQPLAGAQLFLDDVAQAVTTDTQGVAQLLLPAKDVRSKLLRVIHDGKETHLELSRRTQSVRDLAPGLSAGATGDLSQARGMVISDRGIYRPGATLHFKSMLRWPKAGNLEPTAFMPVRLRVLSPKGKEVLNVSGVTNDMGSFAASWNSPPGADIGRYQAVLDSVLSPAPAASTYVQIAEFESPRFKVDVAATATGNKLSAKVEGRYLFGAAMDDAPFTWTLRRGTAPMPNGPMTRSGLVFRGRSSGGSWMRSGEGKLDEAGVAMVTPTLEIDNAIGPQAFTLEAEVTDSSHRAIANRHKLTVHPSDHYAGIRIKDRWVDVGAAIDLELGVIDQKGTAISGRPISVKATHIDWKYTRRPGPGGSVRYDWHEVRTKAGKCTVTSKTVVVGCALRAKRNGRYELAVSSGAVKGGVVSVWAWGSATDAAAAPSPGHLVELMADKGRYAPGESAKVVILNPFAQATAIFTVEQGAVLTTETRTITAGPAEFTVPITKQHAPHIHVTTTLLPIDAKRSEQIADWKFGAKRIAVELEDATVAVNISSDQPNYEPGQKATLTVEVSNGGTPVADAEVALAVVDEGVLRMTNFHAADPVKALRTGAGLQFTIADTRRDWAQMLERSATAGDGGDDETSASVVSTRKNFVRTALWRPHLRTDAQGKVSVELELPDNLTQFRMMAVVLDRVGRGAAKEATFEVRKPLMGIPAVPRFALTGDTYDAAVMVHNGEDKPVTATVTLGDKQETVELKARGRKRVAFTLVAGTPADKKLVFEISDSSGVVRDRVEAKIPVRAAGIDERPHLAGAFIAVQEIMLEVPKGAQSDLAKDAQIEVTVGTRVWPELGSRLEYLIDYPHGCVEQTTSSTLPLLAARDLLPQLGITKFTTKELDKMARAGITRLASMKTNSGGLAYWPGGWEPNAYGTAYAMRAVALAAKYGIEEPGLEQGMADYLLTQLERQKPEVQAGIALALAEAGKLPESSADMLMDTKQTQGLFGLATLALALGSLEGHDAQVGALLDRIEAGFDDTGKIIDTTQVDDFHYYGSAQRTKAQVLLTLARHRPLSKLAPILADKLVRLTASYTTQATAFGLLALREYLGNTADGDAAFYARLDGVALSPDIIRTLELGGGAARFSIPFEAVAGRTAKLRLESTSTGHTQFMVSAKWRRPFASTNVLVATSSKTGPEVYRVYTTAKGTKIDPSKVIPGETVRVAVLARMPAGLDNERRGYLALTDRIPAGFEPLQPDLWTVARPAGITDEHPLFHLMGYGSSASFVELRDDRVHMYFDRFWGEYVAASYLIRATTPGTFVAPPAMAELMYEADSTGYSEHAVFTVAQ